MSSSDSDDDGFYSSVVKNMRIAREQCRKNRGNPPDVCTVNTGKNDQGSSTVENVVNPVKNTENVVNDTPDVSFVDSIEDDLKLDEIIAKNSKPARGRGRGRKKKDTPVEAPKTCSGPTVSNARGRGRSRGGRGRASKNNVTDALRLLSDALDTSDTLSSRGSKRRRNTANGLLSEALNTITGNRRGRGRKKSRPSHSPNSSIDEVLQNQLSSIVNGSVLVQSSGPARQPNMDISQALASFNIPSYPTFSVGNTDEYPDKSDDIPLFSKSSSTNQPVSDDVVMVEETDNLDDNEPLSVKVTWKSFEIFKFTIHKYQKLAPIFETFAQKENVAKDKLLFTYNNKILTCDDTPASIDYNIAKFIDGGVVSHSVKNIINEKVKINGIQIKFQCLNSKKPLEVWIGKDDKVMSAMRQCAELLDIPMNKLKFEFDGDIVTGTCTPQQMGLENGDCIDVMILS